MRRIQGVEDEPGDDHRAGGVRQRLRRLEELFGDRLSDPAFRFEALLALRTHALDAAKETPWNSSRGS
ncbi:helix-turn-helix domain-containing protein [Streptomyces vietnamensis]|uniref:PucR C-terminal helix-turn-helix domain-containing protein n=1 Tax=Streptomyces vietnamensis TaxID=362257 RepID=A0A0B5HP59_9ACTN|nr:helix-turn-helix domain-containing protein [Streptomyces vietnamensis]AJF63905.1 hypothetical protein SVTN_05215 [Streptomyces vietnamensis]